MKFITVFRSISLNELNVVKSILESCEIKVFAWDEATGMIAPHYLFWQGGARLVVPEDQADEAKEIVADYELKKKESWLNKTPFSPIFSAQN